jgi:biopolymer transport protein ExbD
MAFSFTENGGGIRKGRRFGAPTALAEINIVPLVDVVLVLLIIFMITANVMEFGLDIQVPIVRRVQNTAQDLPVVSITKNGESFLNEKPVNINALADAVRQRFHGATAVYVRADKETPWDPIAQIVAELGEAKFEVKMVTAPIDSAARRRPR